jgi:hypothetical protein
MVRIGGFLTARNSGKLHGKQEFSDGDDVKGSPPGPSVVVSVQRVNRTE